MSGLRIELRVQSAAGRALLDVQATLGEGFTALFGPNGAGKSTLLHCIAGLAPELQVRGRLEHRGKVLFDSAQGVDLPAFARRIGVVFQDLRLFPHLDVEQNLLFGRRSVPANARRLSFDRIVEVFELGPLLARRVPGLSGGERQRVALGRALLAEPRMLLLDEPLAALDSRRRRQILPYLGWVRDELELPALYVSHRLDEILELTDRMVVLDQGRVSGEGEVFEVLGRTLHGDLADPFELSATLTATLDHPHEDGSASPARIGEQELVLPFRPLSAGTRVQVGLRPEDVMLSRQRLSGVSARNQLQGTVARVTPLHGRHLVHVDLGADQTLFAELTASALAELQVEPGASVVCVAKTSAFRWLG